MPRKTVKKTVKAGPKKKGGMIWIWGWNWVDGCLKFGPGIEIRELEHNEGTIRVKLFSLEFDEGEEVLEYVAACRKYSALQ